ncbi:hypothetical protein RRG08_025305 [Elysia crispata]|uniref:Transmembrane protein n=1 Tax=Elysia crispata TaxID=231223 RepID=A0AAE1AAG3_9GAST|nr:hypothetical protein RRG08_025305 [Elysia crispata]
MEDKRKQAYSDQSADNPGYPLVNYNSSSNPDGSQQSLTNQPPAYQPPAYELQTYQAQQQSHIATQYPSNVPVPLQQQNVQYVDDNMAISVVSLFFCCILGIFAVIKAQEAKNHAARGNYSIAQEAAKTAQKVAILAISLGCIGVVISFVLGIVLPLVVFGSLSDEHNDVFFGVDSESFSHEQKFKKRLVNPWLSVSAALSSESKDKLSTLLNKLVSSKLTV